MRYQAEIKQFLDRQSGLEENLMKAYALIFGTYCSKAIQSWVEEHPDFEITIRDDPIELLKIINKLMHDTVRAKYPYASLYDVMMRLFNLRQQEHEHLMDYVGSHQVPFPMCTLETLQKYCSTSSLLLNFCLSPSQGKLSSNYELFMYFCFCSFFHSYGSFNHDIFNIFDLP